MRQHRTQWVYARQAWRDVVRRHSLNSRVMRSWGLSPKQTDHLLGGRSVPSPAVLAKVPRGIAWDYLQALRRRFPAE